MLNFSDFVSGNVRFQVSLQLLSGSTRFLEHIRQLESCISINDHRPSLQKFRDEVTFYWQIVISIKS